MKLLKIQNIATLEFHTIKVNRYSVNYNKLWGSQQRNLIGGTRGTLVGISANISATSEYLNQSEMELLGDLLNQPYFLVQYFDTLAGEVREGYYTSSNVSSNLVRLMSKEYKSIDFTLTAVDMRVS